MKKSIKVIFSNFDDKKNPNYGGGGAVAIHEVAKRLVNKYNVTVITGKYKGYKNEVIDGVKYHRIGFLYSNAKLAQITYQLLLPFHIVSTKFDIWFESFTPPFSTGFLQLFTTKPVVGITHFLSAEEKSREYRFPFYIIQNLGLKTYKFIIALSDDIKHKIERVTRNVKISVIHNGVTPIKFKNRTIGDYMLFIGRLEVDQKGIDLLLEAFKKASNRIETNLYIAGSGQPRDIAFIQKKILELRLTRRVKLLGHIEGDEKTSVFGRAKFSVISSRYEAFSLVALESLAYGKPLVTFSIPGLRWLDSRVSLKAKPFSASDLAQQMIEMSLNKTLRNKLHNNCLKLSKLYSWPINAKQYDQLIVSILKPKA